MDQTSPQTNYQQSLIQAGLNPEQASIYELLVKNGPLPAGKIHQKTPLKRGLVYKRLDELLGLGLVVKYDQPGKVALFEPAHPLKLKELAEKREQEAKSAQTVLESVLDPLTSEYNLAVGKPNVQFYEGREGIKKVLADSLSSKTEIYSYADIESIVKYIKDVNEDYVAKRERLKKQKRGILLDTPFARQYLADYHKAVTEARLIKFDAPPFQSVMQIYDDKISYITLAPERMLGVIISDPNIYHMHKYLFEYTWGQAVVLSASPISSDRSKTQ